MIIIIIILPANIASNYKAKIKYLITSLADIMVTSYLGSLMTLFSRPGKYQVPA